MKKNSEDFLNMFSNLISLQMHSIYRFWAVMICNISVELRKLVICLLKMTFCSWQCLDSWYLNFTTKSTLVRVPMDNFKSTRNERHLLGMGSLLLSSWFCKILEAYTTSMPTWALYICCLILHRAQLDSLEQNWISFCKNVHLHD